VALAPGDYRLVLPIVGGTITRDQVRIDAGRTHTVLIDNVAVLDVSVKNRDGTDPGYGVSVTTTDLPHRKVAGFVSGERLLFAPAAVDVKVDAPPQGYSWHAVELRPGHLTNLKLDEAVPGELVVQPVLSNLAIDNQTRVVIYKAGTQQQVALSPPAPAHRLKLDPGDYDVYVENDSGRGAAYAMVKGVHVAPGTTVERRVPLDKGK
jgi:hypothetical protein